MQFIHVLIVMIFFLMFIFSFVLCVVFSYHTNFLSGYRFFILFVYLSTLFDGFSLSNSVTWFLPSILRVLCHYYLKYLWSHQHLSQTLFAYSLGLISFSDAAWLTCLSWPETSNLCASASIVAGMVNKYHCLLNFSLK